MVLLAKYKILVKVIGIERFEGDYEIFYVNTHEVHATRLPRDHKDYYKCLSKCTITV